jgi:threonine aldolase
MPDSYFAQACELARSRGLAAHLDGARLFNAAVASAASGQSAMARLRQIVEPFDTVSVCFSKGLGAPVGSALCGPSDFIERARRIRKMAGGGLRQAGLLAACALHALDHHVDRLAIDHRLAQRLAQGLRGIAGLSVRSAQTNIVFVDVDAGRGPALVDFLKQQGVLVTGLVGLRWVTHLDVDEAGIDHAIASVRRFFQIASEPAAR